MAQKVAVITGAASGIGRATAVALAQVGVRTVIGTFPGDPHDPKETLAAVQAVGGEAIAQEADVRSTEWVDAFADSAITECGRPDFAVSNAGVLRRNDTLMKG
nr:SDR family NAD(P)-dependent oxidoreductase [Rhodococcus sp. 06-621-2]